tara:strand:+ start:373 stop:1635 length:1263 start_codon:yes stop_codon:yes gene_type:complete
MLDLKYLRNNKDHVIKLLKVKNFSAEELISDLFNFDDERKINQQQTDQLLSESKKIAKEIGEYYKSGKENIANDLKLSVSDLKVKIKKLNTEKEELEKKIINILLEIPNVPHISVPVGSSENDNEIIKESGKIPSLDKAAKPHWELIKDYKLIDFELGNLITGSGFPVYTNRGAKLQRALISYFLDKNIEAGYQEFLPPHIVNRDSGFGTGQLPKFEEDLYKISNDDLFLIPTAEVPITNLFRNKILNELPVKCTSYTPCFRREAGSYGKEVRGLNRLHQFDKVEIVQIDRPENSYNILQDMVNHVAKILDDLELPYRILKLCGGDLGFSSSLTFDFEVYSAAQKRWLEVSSVSNFESYQANRLKLRFRDKSGNISLCHTLNGSALALPRVYAAILENNQIKNTIKLPKVLHKYTGFESL